jgi:SAM-dependent methyltransferase
MSAGEVQHQLGTHERLGAERKSSKKMTADRQLRHTFDREAGLYASARPGYPQALFDDIITLSRIPPQGNILEIGCGTGQATLPLARRGYALDCIELGANLAAVARANLDSYPQVTITTSAFEDVPLTERSYDLVISATAFHWIDPGIGYPKIARALKPGGALALFWNKHVQTGGNTGFAQSVQGVYARLAPELARNFPGLPHPDAITLPVEGEMAQSGLFGPVTVRRYGWEQAYTSQAYIDLLNTYSDHLALDPQVRRRLLEGIQEHIEVHFGGLVVKEYLSLLYLAHLKDHR